METTAEKVAEPQSPPPHDPETGEILTQPKPGASPSIKGNVSAPGSGVLSMLQVIDRGRFMNDLEDAMRDGVQSAMNHMKKSVVTVTIELNPDKQTQAMRVAADVKVRTPRPPAHASFFFPTQDGGLTRVDSRQPQMFPGEEE